MGKTLTINGDEGSDSLTVKGQNNTLTVNSVEFMHNLGSHNTYNYTGTGTNDRINLRGNNGNWTSNMVGGNDVLSIYRTNGNTGTFNLGSGADSVEVGIRESGNTGNIVTQNNNLTFNGDADDNFRIFWDQATAPIIQNITLTATGWVIKTEGNNTFTLNGITKFRYGNTYTDIAAYKAQYNIPD